MVQGRLVGSVEVVRAVGWDGPGALLILGNANRVSAAYRPGAHPKKLSPIGTPGYRLRPGSRSLPLLLTLPSMPCRGVGAF